MRTIKFRAWDGKEMFNVFGMKWNTQHNFICGNDEWNHTNSYAPAEKVSEIIMQFTGLLDKNGKEIYEGDIIGEEGVYHFYERVSDGELWEPSQGNWTRLEKKKKNFTGKEEENYICGFELETVEWKDTSCGFEPFSDSDDNCGHCGGGRKSTNFEIIGNIYDTPELLK